VNKISGAALRYRIMAYVTGVVLATAFTWMVVLIVAWMADGHAFADFFSANDQKPGLYGALGFPPSLQHWSNRIDLACRNYSVYVICC